MVDIWIQVRLNSGLQNPSCSGIWGSLFDLRFQTHYIWCSISTRPVQSWWDWDLGSSHFFKICPSFESLWKLTKFSLSWACRLWAWWHGPDFCFRSFDVFAVMCPWSVPFCPSSIAFPRLFYLLLHLMVGGSWLVAPPESPASLGAPLSNSKPNQWQITSCPSTKRLSVYIACNCKYILDIYE